MSINNNEQLQSTAWFIFRSPSNLFDPENYVMTQIPPACGDGNSLCAIRAVMNEYQKPIINADMKEEIVNALLSHKHTANIRLKMRLIK